MEAEGDKDESEETTNTEIPKKGLVKGLLSKFEGANSSNTKNPQLANDRLSTGTVCGLKYTSTKDIQDQQDTDDNTKIKVRDFEKSSTVTAHKVANEKSSVPKETRSKLPYNIKNNKDIPEQNEVESTSKLTCSDEDNCQIANHQRKDQQNIDEHTDIKDSDFVKSSSVKGNIIFSNNGCYAKSLIQEEIKHDLPCRLQSNTDIPRQHEGENTSKPTNTIKDHHSISHQQCKNPQPTSECIDIRSNKKHANAQEKNVMIEQKEGSKELGTMIMTEDKEDLKEKMTVTTYLDARNNDDSDGNIEVNKYILSRDKRDTDRANGIMVLINRLGLSEYYPDKMQLSDVMKIKPKSTPTFTELAFTFVKNLIMSNFTCRDKMVQEYIEHIKKVPKEDSEDPHSKAKPNKISGDLDDLFSDDDDDTVDDTIINPLDLTLTVFRCSSPYLKAILATKLSSCQLAIPFVYPTLDSEVLSVSYWPLRWLILETKVHNGPTQNMSVHCPCQIVACLRIGRPSVSKSKLLNEILNDQYHSTFFNKDCSLGTSNRCISDGLIEAAWYIPSEKSTLMTSLTMYLNLRGDGLHFRKQLQLLSELSTVVIVFLDINLLEKKDIQDQLFPLYECESGVLLAIDSNSYKKSAVKEKLRVYLQKASEQKTKISFSILTMDGSMKSISDIKDDMRRAICDKTKNATRLSLSGRLAKLRTKLDEDDNIYRTVKSNVKTIIDLIPEKCSNPKEKVLPLQGKLWRSYSQKLKAVNKSFQNKSLHDEGKIREEMNALRNRQADICDKLEPFMNTFLDILFRSFKTNNEFLLFVLWIKMVLDERSRSVLPDFLLKYQSDWKALKSARDKNERDLIEKLQNKLDKSEYDLAEASFGFEHICREMGQMFEALSVSRKLKEIKDKLTTIAVQLLIIGQPFEIMDGDAANVPILWVKAVLERLKIVLGDKKLLALSVLGIQSSGKSTLLNTMFGLQFAVSAGRCTRGVFMQLVHVAENKFPFDYILVIDTEGLRAPELAHQKHSHDNELATFVIGLGDITIVNIKGENTAELKDVLQISVHAFLRLKLANKKLNLKQSCIFIHQNVPATDANEKMMQGRQKFVEILDVMTKEAAAQENIADIQSFNQVIEFNSEQNVWYFSDLWRGDPPMAPVNPGYSESVSRVREAILFQLTEKRTTYLTITDTIHRIEDLWNGILKDDFVFSFRNSLELKAYNSLEQYCQNITWGLEKYVLEFISSDGKCSLLNCSDVEHLEHTVPTIITRLCTDIHIKLEYLIKDLDDFVEKNTLKDIMIQWVQHKRHRFKILAESLVDNAKTGLNNTKEEIRIAKLQSSEKTNHEMEINNLARNLAIQMRGELPDENILQQKFNSLWSGWINKFGTKDTRDVVPVNHQIDCMLSQKFPSDATFFQTIKNLPEDASYQSAKQLEGSVNVQWISADDHLSIHRTLGRVHKKLANIGFQAEKTRVCINQTLDVLNMIFRAIDMRLLELNSQDIRFDLSYVTEILNIVTRGIADFNEHTNNDYKFNLLPPFRAMVILHVVRYVSVFFTRLNDTYNRKHSPKAQMEEYKGTAWDLFKNVVECKTEDVIAVGFFREAITKAVIEHVEELLPIDVHERIVALFANGKYSLIKDILIHLADTESFEQIKSYIMNPSEFAEKWILNLTNKTLFVDKVDDISIFVFLAKTRVAKLFTQLSQSISDAMKRCKKDKNFDVSNWIQGLLDSNRDMKGLPLSADSLKHVLNSKLSNLPSFNEMVVENLEEMERHIVDMFKTTKSNSVKWKENPISKIMNKLWGCPEKCMFCKEPCMNTDNEHATMNLPHKCLQHRPEGIGGMHWTRDDKLAIDFCNHSVTTEQTFKVKGLSGKYKDYKKHFPDWDIAPNSDVSKYWMWLMNKYKYDLAVMYDVELPDIPEYWGSIKHKDAIDSLSFK